MPLPLTARSMRLLGSKARLTAGALNGAVVTEPGEQSPAPVSLVRAPYKPAKCCKLTETY